MKTLLVAIASLILTTSISIGADEYVTLTATDGRTVDVKILSVSADGKEVTVLRKERGDSVVVPVSTFNAESQSFIKRLAEKEKKESTSPAISESLISNGDFEKGSTSWNGDKNIEYETELKKNKVCRIQVGENDVEFFQKINGRQDKTFIIKLKIKKSGDYVGEGIVIFFTDNQGNGFGKIVHVRDNNDWNEVEVTAHDITEDKIDIRRVTVIVKSGKSGFLDIDDIEIYRIDSSSNQGMDPTR